MAVRLLSIFVFALCFAILSDLSLAGKKKKKSKDSGSDDTGLAEALHDVKKERRNLCMVSHMHFGASDYHKKKKDAEKEAVISWEGFTAFEYGNDWASFKRASGRKLDCSTNTAGLWKCDAEGRACRKWTRNDRKKYAVKPKNKRKRKRSR